MVTTTTARSACVKAGLICWVTLRERKDGVAVIHGGLVHEIDDVIVTRMLQIMYVNSRFVLRLAASKELSIRSTIHCLGITTTADQLPVVKIWLGELLLYI